ncbi:hypothetical protein [Burkholderia gladioli]|uniref:hypothetical protein n=1 Tax=Burkholderia gladioli TaxID=28095 RepID=UPI001640074F|nr:hypothetical protein [Burkholderia gladioli]
MDLLTLWLGMIAVLLLFGLLMWLRPEWFLSTIWVHPPHHLCDEAISHLYGEGKRVEAAAENAAHLSSTDNKEIEVAAAREAVAANALDREQVCPLNQGAISLRKSQVE